MDGQITCETLFYRPFGEEEMCGKPAVFWCAFEDGTREPKCEDCAKHCHPSRLTPMNSNEIVAQVKNESELEATA